MPLSEPRLNGDGEWEIDEDALEAIALGAAVLGTGGGGNPYLGWLRVRRQLHLGRRVRIVRLEELDPDALVIPTSGIGAPTVGIEKIERGTECLCAVEAIEDLLGRRAAAVMTDEIGGANALEAMVVGSLKGIPVIDADSMGRAFPEVQMSTFFIYGLKPYPTAMCDEKGNKVLFPHADSAQWLERAARAVTIQMGCHAGMAGPPMTAGKGREVMIRGTVRRAWRLGRALLEARAAKANPIEAILAAERGVALFAGKIVDVDRRTTEGFARGTIVIDGLDASTDVRCVVDFQNENLVCRVNQEVRATVPDLICLIESDTGTPVTTEELRYGLRVTVVCLGAPDELKTAEALKVVGPGAFGLDAVYRPL
ncbi:DUF917 domain-containing protein [soil metagenome]